MLRLVACGLLIAKLKNIVVLSSFIHRQSERIYPIEDQTLFYGIKECWVKQRFSHVGIESCSLSKGVSPLQKKLERKTMRMLSAPAENVAREECALHSEEEDISLR